MTDLFERGRTIVLQDVYGGRVWSARPMMVVADEGEFVALWAPKGSIRKVPTNPASRERLATRAERFAMSLTLLDWVHVDNEWDVDSLWLMREGDWHATWVCWREWELWGWYINLQEPFTRTPLGFQTMDLELDVVIEADRSWRYKDRDEFEMLAGRGLIAPERAAAARSEAERVLENLRADAPPFSEDWASWRPDPAWRPPVLVDGWDAT